MLVAPPLAAHGEVEAPHGHGQLPSVAELPEQEGVVVGATELGLESEKNAVEAGVVAAEADGLQEGLLGDGAVAAGGGGGLGAAEVHLGDEAGGPAAGEVGGEFGLGGEMREGRVVAGGESGGGRGPGDSGRVRKRERERMGGGVVVVVQGDLVVVVVVAAVVRVWSVGVGLGVVVLVGFRGGQGAVGWGSRRGHEDGDGGDEDEDDDGGNGGLTGGKNGVTVSSCF